jgi:AraC-like DNA-binding protein
MTESLLQALDWSVRGGACAVLGLTAAVLWRDSGRGVLAKLGIVLALSGVAFSICSMSGMQHLLHLWSLPLRAPAAAQTVILWLCALKLFDDGFRLKWWHAGLWIGVMALCVANGLTPDESPLKPWIIVPLILQAPFFALLAAIHIVATWRGDLVERRRSMRAFIFAGIAVYSVAYTVLDAIAERNDTSHVTRLDFSLVEAVGLLAIALAGAWSLFGTSDRFRVQAMAKGTAETAPTLTATAMTVEDRALLARLEKLMSVERVYRQEALSIGGLAAQLGLPEYRLRRLINQGLGHRNFAGFVNSYRIADAKAGLADPQQAQVPILTIALDAGFASLGPFNRAFKAETGLTPTEYRARAGTAVSEDAPVSASRISNSA